jgi:uncharacterized protein (DUF169 family)
MDNWKEISNSLTKMLHLKSEPIAYKRFENADELDGISGLNRVDHFFTFCQAQFMARVTRLTVGITKEDKLNPRCSRLFGVREAHEKSMQQEAAMLSTTWFPSPEEALKQQRETPRIPAGEAIVLAPLSREKFKPEVVLIYGNPAQIMMVMCGLQKDRYERFHFHFIGEGACADSLAECYTTGKPALSIPCYGERAMGQVADDEISIALPPDEVKRAISGMKTLAKIGFTYPITYIGGLADPTPVLSSIYTMKSS